MEIRMERTIDRKNERRKNEIFFICVNFVLQNIHYLRMSKTVVELNNAIIDILLFNKEALI